MELVDIVIIGLVVYIIMRLMNSRSCPKTENFSINTQDSALREKLTKELIPEIQNLRTSANTLFETQINNIGSHNITRENAQEDLLNLIASQRIGFENRLNTLIDQIEGMVRQY